ncbi:MAG: M14 family metallopeptidase [Thermomicrobiales bacterium]|nr:M14 family metallopeptidase [Thermomicrobiales bacterium]
MTQPNFTELHYLATSAEWRPDRYYTWDLLTELLNEWVSAYPNLATCSSIGRSGEGRDIWVVTLTNQATGPDLEKPAYYIDANIHAAEVMTSSVALATIHYLLTRYDSDPVVRRLLDDTALYVIPRIAVDGSDQFLTSSAAERSVARPFPHGLPDSTWDGLQPQDIDGDGLIGSMRIKDPSGPWKISARDDRIMRPRKPSEYGGEYYFVLPEGFIRNWKGGAINLAPSQSALDFNRNFPADWQPHWQQPGSGPHPLSEPETQAVADFLQSHPNIHGAQLHHTAAGMILRASANYADDQIPRFDRRAYDAIGAMGEATTGFRCYSPFHSNPYQPGKPSYGVESDWLYDHLGILSFMTELWGLAHRAGVRSDNFLDLEEKRTVEQDLQILRLLDEEADGRGVAAWKPFDHPQLGPVELGGLEVKFGLMNPPGPLLAEEMERAVPFAIEAMGTAPRLRVIDAGAEQVAPGTYRVWLTIGNDGFLPTCGSERHRTSGAGRPLLVELALPDGAALLPGSPPAAQEREHLAGRVSQYTSLHLGGGYPNMSRDHIEWLVTAPKGTTLAITARAEKAGVCRTTVVVG